MNKRELIAYIKLQDNLVANKENSLKHSIQAQLARLLKPTYFTAYILKTSSFPMIGDATDGENENENEFYDIYPVHTCQTTSINTAVGIMMDKMAFEAFGCDTPVSTIKVIGPTPVKINIEGASAYEVVLLSNSEYDADTLVGQFILVRTATEIVGEDEVISKVPAESAEELGDFDDFDDIFESADETNE